MDSRKEEKEDGYEIKDVEISIPLVHTTFVVRI